MNDPLQILQDDHGQIDRMLAELSSVPAGSKRTDMAHAAQAWWVEHHELESSIVYAPAGIDGAADAEITAELHAMLASLDGDEDFNRALADLRDRLAEHAETVEHRVLPGLHARLGETEWLAVGDALVRAKHPGGLGASSAVDQAS
jgi:hypothetical protein